MSKINEADVDPTILRKIFEAVSCRRQALWGAGYRPIPLISHFSPLASAGKRPTERLWQLRAEMHPPPCVVATPVWDALNTGIATAGLRVIDIDVENTPTVQKIRQLAFEILGPAPERYRENSARIALPYLAAEGQPSKRAIASAVGKIEVLGRGQQLLAAGVHPSGVRIRWRGFREASDLTSVTEDQVSEFLSSVALLLGDAVVESNGGSMAEVDLARIGSHLGPIADIDRVRSVVAEIPNEGPPDWNSWNRIGMAIFGATGGCDDGYLVFLRWSRKNACHVEETCRIRWEGYSRSPPTSIGFGTLVHIARQASGYVVAPIGEVTLTHVPFSWDALQYLLIHIAQTPDCGWSGGHGRQAALIADARVMGWWIAVGHISESSGRALLIAAESSARRFRLPGDADGPIDWGICAGNADYFQTNGGRQ